jgi:hypothetical protein
VSDGTTVALRSTGLERFSGPGTEDGLCAVNESGIGGDKGKVCRVVIGIKGQPYARASDFDLARADGCLNGTLYGNAS